ncbi:MAG TPA: autotransporter-associated beta strand repeat-containing protein, partial [Chthoniobacterales bacterium]|nr:autotransporter-associated beta strand repeat-containing protein [Chthoniobacterales bacterium]
MGKRLVLTRAKNATGVWLAVAAIVLLSSEVTVAVDTYWTGNTDATWSNNSNWSNSHPGPGDNAIFNSTFSNQPTLTGSPSVGGLWMTGSVGQNVTISGSGVTLTLNGNTINGTAGLGILVNNTNAFALTINVPLKLGGAQTWTNSSGNLLTIGGAVDLSKEALTVNGAGNTTISGIISNSGAFTKTGSGTLTLANTANSFTGQLTVQAGKLKIDNVNDASTNGELGNNASSVILGSSGTTGTLEFSGATDSGTKRFTLATGGTGAFQIDSAGTTLTLNGVIDGSGALVKTGAGTLSLAGLNTYTGGTTINAGTIAINSASSIGASSGAVTINAGTIELLSGNSVSASRLFYLGSAASTIQVDSGSTWTIGTAISNAGTAGGLTKTGAGTLILSSATGNSYGGSGYTTSINGGTLQVGADNVLGNSANTVTFNGGTLLFSAGFTSNRGVVMAGAGTVNTNNNAATLGGVISGAGTLTKTGAGTLTLSGTNTYSGGTAISGGNNSAVSISSASNLGSGTVTVSSGSMLNSTANLTLTNGIVLGAQGGSAQGDGSLVSGMLNVAPGTTLTFSGTGISEANSGTGRLEILGGGT